MYAYSRLSQGTKVYTYTRLSQGPEAKDKK